MFAQVVLPVAVDRPFTYAVPEKLADRCAVGMRAVAPWRSRTETGYIVALSKTTDVDTVKDLIDLPDETPIFSEELLKLTRWIADYYCCAWGEAMQCAVPAGINVRTKIKYTLQENGITAGRFTDRQKQIIAELYKRGTLTEGQLARAIGAKGLGGTLQTLVKREIVIAEAADPKANVSIQMVGWVELVEGYAPTQEDMAKLQRRAPKQAAIYLDLLYGEAAQPVSHLYVKHRAQASVLRGLEKKGMIRREDRELLRTPDLEADGSASEKLMLNGEQSDAYTAIVNAMDADTFQTFLLRGITGSGKTEVYLQAIEHALAQDKSAIILVPEISLTPQTVARFKGRFAEEIAVLHSALGTGERYDEWRRAQRGDVRIVVGARSAVFAPVKDLGIIVVDEEHDTSYKQGETPRYHARDVAIMRANLNKAVCVLGSATPSVESFYNTQRDKSTCLVLKERATNACLPEVQLVDMRVETAEQGANTILSRALEAAVAQRMKAREQVILMLNRRGFAPFALCPSCGWIAECDDCNVTLTYHAKGGYMLCHYCNGEREVPQACAECGTTSLQFVGHGTQKVEEYLHRTFPEARIERMDADTTAGKGGHAQILGRFAAAEIDILVGTQMIAKGHDYPGVTLVGVVNGDTSLGVCDFRAGENTFQLLTQVAGRAGRGDKPGEVIIQTFRPKHYALQCAARHDYDTFFGQEIEERHRSGYPPYRRMANMLIECEDPRMAERAAVALRRIVGEQIEAHDFSGVQVLGPAPSTVRRVQKKYRWNLAILSKSAKRLNTLARATRDAFTQQSKSGKVSLKVDLDPYGMY
jgi:primosomal protein N' (replication factor Y)